MLVCVCVFECEYASFLCPRMKGLSSRTLFGPNFDNKDTWSDCEHTHTHTEREMENAYSCNQVLEVCRKNSLFSTTKVSVQTLFYEINLELFYRDNIDQKVNFK